MEFEFLCLWPPWYVSVLSTSATIVGLSALIYFGTNWMVSLKRGRLVFGRNDVAWLCGFTLLAITSSAVSLAWLSNFDVQRFPSLFTDRLFRGHALGYLFPTVTMLLAILFWSRARVPSHVKSNSPAGMDF